MKIDKTLESKNLSNTFTMVILVFLLIKNAPVSFFLFRSDLIVSLMFFQSEFKESRMFYFRSHVYKLWIFCIFTNQECSSSEVSCLLFVKD